jgi:hypothetical protein
MPHPPLPRHPCHGPARLTEATRKTDNATVMLIVLDLLMTASFKPGLFFHDAGTYPLLGKVKLKVLPFPGMLTASKWPPQLN